MFFWSYIGTRFEDNFFYKLARYHSGLRVSLVKQTCVADSNSLGSVDPDSWCGSESWKREITGFFSGGQAAFHNFEVPSLCWFLAKACSDPPFFPREIRIMILIFSGFSLPFTDQSRTSQQNLKGQLHNRDYITTLICDLTYRFPKIKCSKIIRNWLCSTSESFLGDWKFRFWDLKLNYQNVPVKQI
jgi:hypothetical protein